MEFDSLSALRADFECRSKGSLSMPIAGALVWAVIGFLGVFLPPKAATLALVFGTGAIFPLALVIARVRREQLISNTNPLAKLMGMCVLMVNLLWALHVPLLVHAPEFVPLSLGIALGLHWVVYSWITRHSLGVEHAVFRSVALAAAWWMFPDIRITACAIVVVAAYSFTIPRMVARQSRMVVSGVPASSVG